MITHFSEFHKEVSEIAGNQEISSQQRGALNVLTQWSSIFAPTNTDGSIDQQAAGEIIGCKPNFIAIANEIISSDKFAGEFLLDPIQALLITDPGLENILTESQISALQITAKLQRSFTPEGLTQLQARMPFSVAGETVLGKFLQTNPVLASRYLTSAAPMLHQIRAVVEAVSDPELGVVSFALDQKTDRNASAQIDEATVRTLFVSIINRSNELFHSSDKSPVQMTIVNVPTFPICLEQDGIKRRFGERKVAEDFARWVLDGDSKVKSLRARDLPWDSKLLGFLATLIGRKPLNIIEEITKDSPKFFKELALFREELSKAISTNKRIVFSYMPKSAVMGDPFGLMIIQALELDKGEVSPLQRFAEASYLLNEWGNDRTLSWFYNETAKSSQLYKRMMQFEIPAAEFNSSALTVLAPFLPESKVTARQSFRAKLTEIVNIPGIGRDENSEFLFAKLCANYFPQGSDMAQDLEVLFEYAPFISEEQFHDLLLLMRSFGVHEVTDKTLYLAKEKFFLSMDVMSKYKYFCTYRPHKIGELPQFFEDAATFSCYVDIGVGALGVAKECDELLAQLEQSNIVVVVDGTSYHPELASEIQGETVVAEVEHTTEMWGKYTRPGRRLIDALTRSILKGESEKFKDYSVIKSRELSKLGVAQQRVYKKVFGIDIGLQPSISEINDVLEAINTYDDKSIIIIDAESINDLRQMSRLLHAMNERDYKVIVRAREPIPGLPQVLLSPWTENDVKDRLKNERADVSTELGLSSPLSNEIIDFVAKHVDRFRGPQDDPMHFALAVLQSATNHAKAFKSSELIQKDVTAALPSIFHLPDPERTRHVVNTIDEFLKIAPALVLGQDKAIREIAMAVKSHLFGTRNSKKPLAYMLPGPTGVGKTELLEAIARAAGVSYCKIDGSAYSEPHSISRLFGSPPGYVGEDEGPLFRFLRDNAFSIVFIDEYEKMHPEVYKSLMNFVDRGVVTAGNGQSCTRPGTMIFAATNAGATKFKRGMSMDEVKEILTEAFREASGIDRPELVARWTIQVMFAIEEDAFKDVVRKTLGEFGERYGIIAANIKVTTIDDKAIEILYEEVKKVCAFEEKREVMGFDKTEKTLTESTQSYHDLRYLNTAFDHLAQESVVSVVEEMHRSGKSLGREVSVEMKLVADSEGKKILLVPVKNVQ